MKLQAVAAMVSTPSTVHWLVIVSCIVHLGLTAVVDRSYLLGLDDCTFGSLLKVLAHSSASTVSEPLDLQEFHDGLLLLLAA